MIYESFSEEETKQVATDIAKNSKQGDVYCLTGELGAGKTIFSKGFANGLGIDKLITSPTFTLLNEYGGGRLSLYHFDVYRINSIDEMEDTGFEDYFYGDGVCLIEWAELIKQLIPINAFLITIKRDYSKGENYRFIELGEFFA